MSSRDVDAIWAQLKAKTAPKPVAPPTTGQAEMERLMRQLNNGMDMQETSHQPVPESGMFSMQGHTSTGMARSSKPAQQDVNTTVAPESSACTGEELTALLEQSLPRLISMLQDGSSTPHARRAALQDIQALLLRPASALPVPEPTTQDWLEGKLGKALLRRFDDPAEACRELAISILSSLLQAAPNSVLVLMPYVVPVLEERLCWAKDGGKTPHEPSEEIRLQLSRLLLLLVKLAAKAVAAYAAEVVGMVKVLCDDPFHEVNIEACSIVLAMNDSLGLRLQPAAKELVAVLLPLAAHKRHRVRVAAVRAVGATMHQGAHEMILEMIAFRDPNLIEIKAFYGDDLKVNFCGKLASDPNAQVRLEFLHVVGDWLLHLPERLDHEHRLMPYLVSALNDDNTQIQETALQLLEQAGQQYLKDHASEVEEMARYLPSEAQGLVWLEQGDASGIIYGSHSSGRGAGTSHAQDSAVPYADGVAGPRRQPLLLPGPCKARPSLGARMVVQTNLSRAVHPLLAEMQAWQDEPRLRAALLLRTSLVFSEAAAHQHLQLMVPVFCKTILDPQLGPVVADCTAIVAAFTPPALYLQLLGRRLEAPENEQQRAAALAALAHVVRGAGPRGAMDAHLPQLLSILEDPWLLHSRDTKVCTSALYLTRQIIATCPAAVAALAPRVLWVLLHLERPDGECVNAAAAHASVNYPESKGPLGGGPGGQDGAGPGAGAGALAGAEGEGVLGMLATACGLPCGDAVVAAHRLTLLRRLSPPKEHSEATPAGGQQGPGQRLEDASGQASFQEQQGETSGGSSGSGRSSALVATSAPPPELDRVGFAPSPAPLQLLCRLLLNHYAREANVLSVSDAAVFATVPPSPYPHPDGNRPGAGSEPSVGGSWQVWDTVTFVTALEAAQQVLAGTSHATGASPPPLGLLLALERALACFPRPAGVPHTSVDVAGGIGVMADRLEQAIMALLSAPLQQQGAPLLLAMRLLQASIERQLLSTQTLAGQSEKILVCPLTTALSSTLIQCRLQACYTSSVVIRAVFASQGPARNSANRSTFQGETASAAQGMDAIMNGAGLPLAALMGALADRMHDPQDEVRVAALQALQVAVKAALMRVHGSAQGPGSLETEGAALARGQGGGPAEGREQEEVLVAALAGAVKQVAAAPEVVGGVRVQWVAWLQWLKAEAGVLWPLAAAAGVDDAKLV